MAAKLYGAIPAVASGDGSSPASIVGSSAAEVETSAPMSAARRLALFVGSACVLTVGAIGATQAGDAGDEATGLSSAAARTTGFEPANVKFPRQANHSLWNNSKLYCDVPFDMVSLYKYTLASANASMDGTFVGEWLGCDAEEDTSDVDTGCAVADKRACITSGGESLFSLHHVTSFVTPAGNQSVADLDALIATMHGDMKQWDQFMHYKVRRALLGVVRTHKRAFI